jgi:hypothetical protein
MEFMEQEKISGTIMLCPGVAEELLGGSAYMVRDGVFIDSDLPVRHAGCATIVLAAKQRSCPLHWPHLPDRLR